MFSSLQGLRGGQIAAANAPASISSRCLSRRVVSRPAALAGVTCALALFAILPSLFGQVRSLMHGGHRFSHMDGHYIAPTKYKNKWNDDIRDVLRSPSRPRRRSYFPRNRPNGVNPLNQQSMHTTLNMSDSQPPTIGVVQSYVPSRAPTITSQLFSPAPQQVPLRLSEALLTQLELQSRTEALQARNQEDVLGLPNVYPVRRQHQGYTSVTGQPSPINTVHTRMFPQRRTTQPLAASLPSVQTRLAPQNRRIDAATTLEVPSSLLDTDIVQRHVANQNTQNSMMSAALLTELYKLAM